MTKPCSWKIPIQEETLDWETFASGQVLICQSVLNVQNFSKDKNYFNSIWLFKFDPIHFRPRKSWPSRLVRFRALDLFWDADRPRSWLAQIVRFWPPDRLETWTIRKAWNKWIDRLYRISFSFSIQKLKVTPETNNLHLKFNGRGIILDTMQSEIRRRFASVRDAAIGLLCEMIFVPSKKQIQRIGHGSIHFDRILRLN